MFEYPEGKKLITGRYVNIEKIIARCHLLTHPGYLTKTLVDLHNCIDKDCTFFEKIDSAPYWQGVERTSQNKKKARSKKKQALQVQKNRDEFIRKTLESNGHVHVTSIREESQNLLVISYIYDMKVDLTQEIQVLRKALKKIIKLQAKLASDKVIRQLI